MKTLKKIIADLYKDAEKYSYQDKIDLANQAYKQILDREPEEVLAIRGLAENYTKTNDVKNAFNMWSRYLGLNAEDIEAWHSFFKVICRDGSGDFDSIFTENFSAFSDLFLNDPEVISQLGKALYREQIYSNSLDVFMKAISLKSNDMRNPDKSCFDDFVYLADTYNKLGNPSSSVRALKLALMLDPDRKGLMSTIIKHKHLACEWDSYYENNQYLIDLVRKKLLIEMPFTFLNISGCAEDQLYCANQYKPASHIICKKSDFKVKNNKIRIGYVSADFYFHATIILAKKLFELHDKHKFEIIAFNLNSYADSTTEELKNIFTEFYDISGLDACNAAEFISNKKIDILVDLKGYTKGQRKEIFSYRPATIQINYLGYPGTMGNDFIDYIIADGVVIPDGFEDFYGEKIIRLPFSYQVNNNEKNTSLVVTTRVEHGLPDGVFVFCCFNNNYKITPHTFAVWMEILNTCEQSVLWLFKDNDDAERNLKLHAESYGVDSDRLIFAPKIEYDRHLERHRHADLFLDTLPYNAHTTASDALWTGLPVLTCPGQSFASRVAASLINAVGLPNLIAEDYTQYKSIALSLFSDRRLLNEYKRQLLKNREINNLFNSELTTRYIEQAYIKIYENNIQGLAPEHITINP